MEKSVGVKFMTLWIALIIGAVYGAAEILPISASAHMAYINNYLPLNCTQAEMAALNTMMTLGVLIAISLSFGSDIVKMIKELIYTFAVNDDIERVERDGRMSPNARLAVFLLISLLPIVVYMFFESSLDKLSSNGLYIGFASLITAGVIYVSGQLNTGRKGSKQIGLTDALIVGAAHAIGLIPGLSRTGATYAAGVSRGFKQEFSIKYTMLLGVPTYLFLLLTSFYDAISIGLNFSILLTCLGGLVTSFIGGYAALLGLRYIVTRGKTYYLAYYCGALGVISIILSFII